MAKKSKPRTMKIDAGTAVLNITIARFGDCPACGKRIELDSKGAINIHPCSGRKPESKDERDRRISGEVRDRLSSFFGWKP